jgi:putative ABC transport system substrate-binding protein
VAWPLAARAQQPAMLVVGWLSSTSPDAVARYAAGFRKGLSENGYIEGQNVTLEYRFANGQYDRLPAMAAELVRRPVAIIIAQGPPAALAAKAVTAAIPIVFVVGFDPVAAGLVASFNRPGGNATGVTILTSPLGQKRLEFMLELVPRRPVFGMLVNPKSPDTESDVRDAQAVASANGQQLQVLNARTEGEIDTAFASFVQQRVNALLVGSDPFFLARTEQIVGLAASHRLPAIYPFREFVASGGLISYGASLADAFRQAGTYAGQILKGTKPVDLPVRQPTAFELVINLRTAKALGLAVPATLQARADEVIE